MSTDPLAEALYQRDCWERQAQQERRRYDLLRGEVNHERLEQMSEHVNTPHCECDKCENWTRDHQPEQQGDVIARMLDAGDLSHGEDSWRSYCAEDQAQFRKAMTAAARVLLDEALGPVTGEEARQLWCSDQHVISFANKVIAARRARILTESKPRIPEALRTVYEYLKQNQPETEAAAIRYIEHIEDHNGER